MKSIVISEIYKYINENDTVNDTVNDTPNDTVSGDVKQIEKLKPPALKKMQARVDNQREFNEAFTNWFESLGVSTEEFKKRINITTSISHITNIMKEKGIKF